MAIGLRYIPDRDEVRDVLQDSFVSILTSIDEFDYRGEGSLKSWVSRIVTNHALDWLRDHDRMRKTDDLPDEADEEADDEQPDVDKVPPDILNSMIGRLPDGYRMVLNLHVFSQMPHQEIARKLGIKEASSASQFFHAKRLLAEMIKEYINSQKR